MSANAVISSRINFTSVASIVPVMVRFVTVAGSICAVTKVPSVPAVDPFIVILTWASANVVSSNNTRIDNDLLTNIFVLKVISF